MSDMKKFKSIDKLHDRVVDLSETERKSHQAAKQIYKTLLGIVNKKNEQANTYEKDFDGRLDEKLANRVKRAKIKAKKETSASTKKEQKQNNGKDYKEVLEWIKKENKNAESMQDTIFKIIKRAFNKNVYFHKGSDIDKDASLFLLKATGFFKDNDNKRIELNKAISEIPEGESGEKWLSIDTGGTVSGIKIENVEKNHTTGKKHKSLIHSKVIVSEHSDLSLEAKNTQRPTSSAHMIYHILDQLGQLPTQKKEQLKRFINFVDIVDSLDYQASGMDYPNSYRTLFGLYRNLNINDIFGYFADPKNTGFEILSDEYMNKQKIMKRYRKNNERVEEQTTLKEIANKQKERVEKNMAQINDTQRKGQFGKYKGAMYHIALGNEINDGPQVASYYGGGLLKIYPSGDLYMYSPQLLPKKILNFNTDDHFLTIRNIKAEDLKKIIDLFEFNARVKETEGVKERILAYHESITKQQKETKQGDINNLPKELDIKKLEIGKILTGIVHNVNGKYIYVNLTPTIKGLIKEDKKEKDLKWGEEIRVRVKNISQWENNIPHIELEKVA